MNDVNTQIDIAAPADLVWAILLDFRTYGRWNPLIRGVLGRADMGREIEVRMRSDRGESLRMRPTIVRVREPRELRWLERWRIPGLYSSERRFRIETLRNGRVRFHHGERAGGLMQLLLGTRMRVAGTTGCDAMNTALKRRAERAWNDGVAPEHVSADATRR